MRDSGVYPAAALLALGFDRGAIRRAVLSGDLTQLRWGWFAAANHDARTASAVRDGGVLTCVDALRFHELWTPPGHNGLHLRRSRNLSGKNRACRPPTGCVRSAREAVDPLPVSLLYAVGCLPLDEWVAVCDSYLNSTGTESIVRVRLDLPASTLWSNRRSRAWVTQPPRRSAADRMRQRPAPREPSRLRTRSLPRSQSSSRRLARPPAHLRRHPLRLGRCPRRHPVDHQAGPAPRSHAAGDRDGSKVSTAIATRGQYSLGVRSQY